MDDYLKEYDQIDWRSRAVQCKGSTIYFYCSDKKRVMYEGVVIMSPVSNEVMFNDADYSNDGAYTDSLLNSKEGDHHDVMRIQITKRAEESDEAISRQQLLEHGFPQYCMAGIVELDKLPELESYIKGAFAKYPPCKTDSRTPNIISKKDMYIQQLESCKNLILNGAPGTGKTFLAKQIAAEMILGHEYNVEHPNIDDMAQVGKNCQFVQFHPSYDYTDFVEGLRPVDDGNGKIGFERKDGVFKGFCKRALTNREQKHVFIIDEINRGDMSKILGELFFSIDPGYRGELGKVMTQYQNLIDSNDIFHEGFYVPENVYIIGTMNDIDRSVESMDFAMRRRFTFREITATERQNAILGSNQEAKDCMNQLNAAIEKIPGLNTSYHIGPAYFKDYSKEHSQALWNNKIKGLLYEYLRGMPNADELLKDLKNAYDLKNAIDTKDATNESVKQTDDDGATER